MNVVPCRTETPSYIDSYTQIRLTLQIQDCQKHTEDTQSLTQHS